MAEFAAHITDSVSIQGRPSLFELFAIDSLSSSLKPAFDHCYRVLAASYPLFAEKCHSSRNLIYYGFLSAIELNHMTRHNASLAEYFYGIVRTDSKSHSYSLSNLAKFASIIEVIIIPFLKEYLDKLYLSIKEKELDQSISRTSNKYSLKRLYYIIYPYIHFISKMYSVFLYLRYGFQRTDQPTLFMQLLKMHFRYAKPVDNTTSEPDNTTFINSAAVKLKKGFNVVSHSIPVAVFFVKFIEWWYSQDTDLHRNISSLPIPPPPHTDKSAIGIQLCSIPSQCPICQSEQKAPSLLSTSGVLYCYSCIHQHVSTMGRCAVTNLPSTIENIIRVYIE